MMCPKCGKEMKKGYLFSSKDGAFSFASEVPSALKNAKKHGGLCEAHRIEGRWPYKRGRLLL